MNACTRYTHLKFINSTPPHPRPPLPPFLFLHHFTLNPNVQTPVQPHPPTTFIFSPFFMSVCVCQSWRIASIDATSSHAFACFCVEQKKKEKKKKRDFYPLQTVELLLFFSKRCVIKRPCMLDMYGFCLYFLFLFFISVLEDVFFVG